METLEKSVEELTRENTSLLRENQSMAREIYALRQQLVGGGAVADPSALGDAASLRQSALTMGARGGAFGLSAGLLAASEGASTTARLSAGITSPSRSSLTAASRSALVAPSSMDMATFGGLGNMHMMPPVQDDQLTLEMIRRRRAALAATAPAPPSEEEQQLLDAMRRRRGQL